MFLARKGVANVLISAFSNFYCHYNDLACRYNFLLALMLCGVTHFYNGLFHSPGLDIGLTADVAGQQGMLAPPGHLITYLVLADSLICAS
jgi:hypothetical protein